MATPIWVGYVLPATALIWVLRGRGQYVLAVVISFALAALSGVVSVQSLAGMPVPGWEGRFLGTPVAFQPDALGSIFSLVVSVICPLALVVGGQHFFKAQKDPRQQTGLGLHLFAYLWLQAGMTGVAWAQGGWAFLGAWEVMTVSSFLLILFNASSLSVRRAAVGYLVQMHLGFFALLFATLLLDQTTGSAGFDALAALGSRPVAWAVLGLFFVGFGMKMGIVPLHTWLPHAHPAAPPHVSAVMSGVMIKMGVLGLLRVLAAWQGGWAVPAAVLIILGVVSGIYAIAMATLQKDIKRLLAYSSIENISIITLGIGIGLLGLHTGVPLLVFGGFAGALLHVINHGLFKPLLFTLVGNVYQSTHTRDMNQLGGLAHRMPHTTAMFAVGAVAICGLPPLNGFVGEFVLYGSLLKGMKEMGTESALLLLFGLIGLAVMGGLAVYAFAKAFGITFLGAARSEASAHAHEAPIASRAGQWVLVALMLGIGLLPMLAVGVVSPAVRLLSHLPLDTTMVESFASLDGLALASGVLLGLVGLFGGIRRWQQRRVAVETGPAWGCGYTALDAKHQYTATTFSEPLRHLLGNAAGVNSTHKVLSPTDYFPADGHLATHLHDPLEHATTGRATRPFRWLVRHLRVFQTGRVQHYVLFPLLFLALLGLLTLLDVL